MNLEIKRQICSAARKDDYRRRVKKIICNPLTETEAVAMENPSAEASVTIPEIKFTKLFINGEFVDSISEEKKQQEWEEERMKKALGTLGKAKERNRAKKCGSRERSEEKWFLKSPPLFDPKMKAKTDQIDRLPFCQEEEKQQEWEEERMKKALGSLAKEKERNRKKKRGSRKRAEEKLFLESAPNFHAEFQASINEIHRLPFGQGFQTRDTRGNLNYVIRTGDSGCFSIGEDPHEEVGILAVYGANFLSKTIKITPDGSDSRLDRICVDETKIAVRGKDSVCAVARRGYQDTVLGTVALALADLRWLGKNGLPVDPADHEEMMMPFSEVTFSLDTEKEGCKDGEYIQSEGCKDSWVQEYEPLRDEDLAAHFNEQKAVTFLESKMRQDPVINQEETIQTAITAFKYLLPEGFKSDEIKVCIVGRGVPIDRELSVQEIEERLTVTSL